MKKKYGFTIIELLVTVLVVGILATVGLNFYTNQQKHARDATRKSDLSLISTALQSYYAINKVYPLVEDGASGGYAIPANMQQNSALKQKIHYTSDGGRWWLINNISGKSLPANNTSKEDWIPLLRNNFIANLPVDPKQKPFTTNYVNNIDNYSNIYNQAFNEPSNKYWTGGIHNTWLYQYSPFNSDYFWFPRKAYLLTAALENTNDKDTIENSGKSLFDKPNADLKNFWSNNLYFIVSY